MKRRATSSTTVSPRASTEPRRGAWRAAAGLLALLVAGSASAHDVTSHAVRELVRIQGQLGTATAPPNGRQVTFVVRGQRLPFTASEWRVFAFADDITLKQPEAPARARRRPPLPPRHHGARSVMPSRRTLARFAGSVRADGGSVSWKDALETLHKQSPRSSRGSGSHRYYWGIDFHAALASAAQFR
jgi:hypothetical protein